MNSGLHFQAVPDEALLVLGLIVIALFGVEIIFGCNNDWLQIGRQGFKKLFLQVLKLAFRWRDKAFEKTEKDHA